MKVRLKDIADKSGYSITTVSRALAGYDDVNEETRKRIVELAISMGYQPNVVARQLRIQRTYTIGMIIPGQDSGFSDDFFSELMMGVGHAASTNGYDLLLSAQTSSENEMEAYHRIVGGNRVDGVVLARTRRNDERIRYLKEVQHPFVVSGRSAPGEKSDFPYVDLDSQRGIEMMVQHLANLGHQHIALLLPPEEIAFTPYRLQGFRNGLEKAGLPYHPEYTRYGDLHRSGGYHRARELVSEYPQITAILACNDLMAFGTIRALRDMGLRAGKDIAVTGFDDIPAAAFAHPPLTTIRQPIYEIGQQLIEMLVHLIQGKVLPEQHILLVPELVIRESSGSNIA